MKILIIRFSSIGDIVLTSPVVRCIRQQLDAEIHYLTKKPFAAIPGANPYISRVWATDGDLKALLPELRLQKFDLIVDLHKNWRSWQVKRSLGVRSLSFDKLNIEKWLMVNLKVDRLPRKHLVDRYIEALQPLGIVHDGKGLDYFIPADARIEPASFILSNAQDENWLKEHFPAGESGFRYFAVVTGAAHKTKALPEDKLKTLCSNLSLPVVLLGGSNESSAGDRIAAQSGLHVVNACGKCSLHGSASLIQQAEKVYTPDTGMMHIAAAFHKDIISFWGNTIPAFGMYPYFGQSGGNSIIREVTGLSCRPCSKIGYEQCPKGHFRCMNEINVR